ncbi:MAG: thiamine-phosphate kinase [Gammaproteobacteria bacterium]|nr:thiamine-phosphate kinase [Gammaproteobacteria bacterium]
MSEFDLITHYFKHLSAQRPDVVLGIGDDCALLEVPSGMQLAMSTDTLNAGVHFPENTHPVDIGYKSLAVNLSDLAAMGAKPAWVSLNLSLPDYDTDWLDGFCQGFAELSRQYAIQLVGGDTTRGPLSISVQVYGFVEPGRAMRRDAAKVGDQIYVTGTLGDAGLGLKQCLGSLEDVPGYCLERLNRPQPRVDLGLMLAPYSRCAIDISDGLIADLGHILEQSHCGARIELERIPLSAPLAGYYGDEKDWPLILTSGDDYELCFTVAKQLQGPMLAMLNQQDVAVTRIGEITEAEGLLCVDQQGQQLSFEHSGYNHFKS